MAGEVVELFAFLARRPDGSEGVVGGQMPDGTIMPMVADNEAQMRALLPTAQGIANVSSMPMRVVRFTRAEDVDTIEPGVMRGDVIEPGFSTQFSVDSLPKTDGSRT